MNVFLLLYVYYILTSAYWDLFLAYLVAPRAPLGLICSLKVLMRRLFYFSLSNDQFISSNDLLSDCINIIVVRMCGESFIAGLKFWNTNSCLDQVTLNLR